MTAYTGTAGNDTQNGTGGADTFDYSQGGKDKLDGKGGDDFFTMGAALDAGDSIQGGTGIDTVILNGDYSAGLTFGAATISNVETLQLIAGHDYTLTLDNANITLGNTFKVDGTALGAADNLIFDGSAETSSAITVFGGGAADTIWTGDGDDLVTGGGGFNTIHTGDGYDFIDIGGSTHNTVLAGDGDDRIFAGANFVAGGGAGDVIDGGTGKDTLELDGNYAAAVLFAADTIRNIDKIKVDAGHDYNLALHAKNLDFDDLLIVDGSLLGVADNLTVDGSTITEGRLKLIGGLGADVLRIGQSGEDIVKAGGGDDTITTGAYFAETVRLHGGLGNDVLILSGDYSDRLELLSQTMRDIETISLAASAGDYYLATNDGNVGAGGALMVDGSALLDYQMLRFDGSAESNGTFTFIGGAGANVLTGGSVDDTFDMSLGGSHTLAGGAGNDTFLMGAAYAPSSVIDGELGFDTVNLTGNYSGGAIIDAINIETLVLGAGFDYTLDIGNEVLSAGQDLVVDATALTAADAVQIDASDVQNGPIEFQLGGSFKAGDSLVGGAGADSLGLDGDYSSGLNFGEAIISGIEHVFLTAGNGYNLTLGDANFFAGETLRIDGGTLGAADVLVFDGELASEGALYVFGGAGGDSLSGGVGTDSGSTTALYGGSGDDTIIGRGGASSLFGGANSDHIYASPGGTDAVYGGNGDDEIFFGGALDSSDLIDGGDGNDTLTLKGDYSLGFRVLVTYAVETVMFTTGDSYDFQLDGTGVAATYDGSTLDAAHELILNCLSTGTPLTLKGGAGSDTFLGGSAADTVIGGGGDDVLAGGYGSDLLNGGSGVDAFSYQSVLVSTGAACDVLVAVNFNQDQFDLSVLPSAIDAAVNSGSLSTVTFDADLAGRITAARLHLGDAVLYTPNSGTLAGHKFLIVDANGVAGYQAGQDYVIEVTGSSGALGTGDFI